MSHRIGPYVAAYHHNSITVVSQWYSCVSIFIASGIRRFAHYPVSVDADGATHHQHTLVKISLSTKSTLGNGDVLLAVLTVLLIFALVFPFCPDRYV